MNITKHAVAGTLESSDCMVTIEPNASGVDFHLESVVAHQFGNQIRAVALETLQKLNVESVKISIVDKGALDCTIKARIEAAVYRSQDTFSNLPWGGAIQ